MSYYKKNNKVYDFNDLQVKAGIGEDYTPITDEEAEAILNPPLTDEEQSQKIKDEKWQEYYNYMNSLTIDIVIDENTTHKYKANPSSLIKIERKAKSPYLLEVKEIKWYEDWGEFMTNKIELEKVILESDRLSQSKLNEIFGV